MENFQRDDDVFCVASIIVLACAGLVIAYALFANY